MTGAQIHAPSEEQREDWAQRGFSLVIKAMVSRDKGEVATEAFTNDLRKHTEEGENLIKALQAALMHQLTQVSVYRRWMDIITTLVEKTKQGPDTLDLAYTWCECRFKAVTVRLDETGILLTSTQGETLKLEPHYSPSREEYARMADFFEEAAKAKSG